MAQKPRLGPARADSVRVADYIRWHATSEVSSYASRCFQQLFVQQSRHAASSESSHLPDSIPSVSEGAEFSGRVTVDGIVGILRREGEGWSLSFPCLSTYDNHEFSPHTNKWDDDEDSQSVYRQPNGSPDQRRAHRRRHNRPSETFPPLRRWELYFHRVDRVSDNPKLSVIQHNERDINRDEK